MWQRKLGVREEHKMREGERERKTRALSHTHIGSSMCNMIKPKMLCVDKCYNVYCVHKKVIFSLSLAFLLSHFSQSEQRGGKLYKRKVLCDILISGVHTPSTMEKERKNRAEKFFSYFKTTSMFSSVASVSSTRQVAFSALLSNPPSSNYNPHSFFYWWTE
jgi:hypothetical protein